MIALIDYGVGNLRSVAKALAAVGAEVRVTSSAAEILAAEKVVLPGVGAFGDGMAGLHQLGLVAALQQIAAHGTPLLGICLGMQLLFEESEEMGTHQGLGLLEGRVLRFPESALKVPHTGWNQVQFEGESPLFTGMQAGSYAYFNHGYYCRPKKEQDTLAMTEYILTFASVVGKSRLYGVQFHPEKSQQVGLQLLRNFVERG